MAKMRQTVRERRAVVEAVVPGAHALLQTLLKGFLLIPNFQHLGFKFGKIGCLGLLHHTPDQKTTRAAGPPSLARGRYHPARGDFILRCYTALAASSTTRQPPGHIYNFLIIIVPDLGSKIKLRA